MMFPPFYRYPYYRNYHTYYNNYYNNIRPEVNNIDTDIKEQSNQELKKEKR